MSLVYKIGRAIAIPIQKLFWPTKVINKEYLIEIEGKAILICNHYATPDSIIIGCKLFKNDIHALVKADSFQKKFGAKFLTNIGCVPVRRGEGDIIAAKKILELLKKDQKIVIYPEGTRNKIGSKEMLPLKPGVAMFAYMGKAPIVPMLYYRKHKIFHKNYAILGKPFYISDYFTGKPDFNEATMLVANKMKELRVELDEIVETRKHVKKK